MRALFSVAYRWLFVKGQNKGRDIRGCKNQKQDAAHSDLDPVDTLVDGLRNFVTRFVDNVNEPVIRTRFLPMPNLRNARSRLCHPITLT